MHLTVVTAVDGVYATTAGLYVAFVFAETAVVAPRWQMGNCFAFVVEGNWAMAARPCSASYDDLGEQDSQALHFVVVSHSRDMDRERVLRGQGSALSLVVFEAGLVDS